VVIVSAGLVELLLLLPLVEEDDEFGALDRRSLTMLWAVEVSPELRALVRELSAFDSGSELLEDPALCVA
jgi:hypothetical protein